MRKVLVIVFISFFSTSTKAQEIFKDSTVNVVYMHNIKLDFIDEWGFVDSLKLVEKSKDSVQYRLNRTTVGRNNPTIISASLDILIANKKVYCSGEIHLEKFSLRDTISLTDVVLFNFSLNAKDTFFFKIDEQHDSSFYVIDSVGLITLENGEKAVAQFYGGDKYNAYDIGNSEAGLLGQLFYHANIDGINYYQQKLIAACESGEKLYCTGQWVPDYDDYMDKCCDIDSLAPFWATFLGVKNPSKKPVSIYPNPCTDYLFFTDVAAAKYVIIDATGRELTSGVFHNKQIDVSSLPPGLYRVILSNQRQVYHSSFIKL